MAARCSLGGSGEPDPHRRRGPCGAALSRSYLHLRCRFVNTDGASVEAGRRARVPHASRPVVVSRRTLIDAVRRQDQARLVVVRAPAGYGKSSLLREWSELDERPVVSVTLDAADDDPVVLARSVAGGFVAAGLVSKEAADLWARPSASLRPEAVLLPRALEGLAVPFVLLVDELDRVAAPQSMALLDRIVECVPRGAQVVLAGRRPPSFAARRRVQGDVAEIGPDELTLDAEGTVAVFADVGVDLGLDAARLVTDHAEGWPAGIYLSALVARDAPEKFVPGQVVRGTDRFVADYLMREVFEHLPPKRQTFLMRAAVLDDLCAPLCEHVTGIGGAPAMLRATEETNSFLVPLDRDRTWYRFHNLFRDFLLGELQRLDPGSVAGMQRRAAVWCRENGRPEQAVEYLVRAQAFDEIGPLLTAVIRPAYLEGRVSTIESWLARCGERTIAHFPPLAVLAGWVEAMSGSPGGAVRWAALADGLAYDGDTGSGFVSYASEAASLRALMCANGVEAMLRDAQFTVECEPEWSPWRNTALWLLGQAHELGGDPEAAVRCHDEGLRVDEERGSRPLLVTLVSRALLAMDEGDWPGARRWIEQAEEPGAMVGSGDYPEVFLLHAAGARLALHDGDKAKLATKLEAAMGTRRVATWAVPHAAVHARLILVDIALVLGDRPRAKMLQLEAEEVLVRRPNLGVLVDRVRRSRERLEAVGAGGALAHGERLTPAELRLLPYLSTHLTFPEIGKKLYVSRNTVATHVGSIYRKLGVSSRSAAVERLRELGLDYGQPETHEEVHRDGPG